MHEDWTREDVGALEAFLSRRLPRPWRAVAARPPRGGIQPARLFHGGDGPSVFAKKGGDPAAARRFEAELDGLSRLGASGAVRTPGVLGLLHLPHGAAALVLEAVHAVRPTWEAWIELGRQVAALHGHTSHGFGLDRDNFIGLEPQPNGPMPDWPRSYAERRLRPMLAPRPLRGTCRRTPPGRWSG